MLHVQIFNDLAGKNANMTIIIISNLPKNSFIILSPLFLILN